MAVTYCCVTNQSQHCALKQHSLIVMLSRFGRLTGSAGWFLLRVPHVTTVRWWLLKGFLISTSGAWAGKRQTGGAWISWASLSITISLWSVYMMSSLWLLQGSHLLSFQRCVIQGENQGRCVAFDDLALSPQASPPATFSLKVSDESPSIFNGSWWEPRQKISRHFLKSLHLGNFHFNLLLGCHNRTGI